MNGFDLLLLAFKGIAIASLPIAAVWVGRASRHGADRLRRLAWVTAFVTFDLIVFGGFTRLTDSGLGCPDWPGCYAKANPFMASTAIEQAETAMPFGPVTMAKAWIEMIHRYLAMAVGLLIVTMLIVSVARWWRGRRLAPATADARPPAFPGMTLTLLALVVMQGAFGAWTVTQKLQPIFVATHLMLGLGLLGTLIVHALRFGGRPREIGDPALPSRAFAAGALLLLALQIALGGWVSANYAVLACTDFPKCQGVWLPTMDFASGFHLWRALGRTEDGGYLSVAALTAIHWTHRSFAVVVFGVLGTLAWRSRRVPTLAAASVALGALLVLQFATGLVNVVFAWPLVAAVLHSAGAAGLVAALVVINYRLPRNSVASDPSLVVGSMRSSLPAWAGRLEPAARSATATPE